MLSTVLNSDRAIAVNIAIIRTFVRLKQLTDPPPEPPKKPIGFIPPPRGKRQGFPVWSRPGFCIGRSLG